MELREQLTQWNWSRFVRRAALFLIVGALVFYAAEPWLPWNTQARPRTIIVYGFSILGEVMNLAIFPAFQKEWQARTGEHVEFIASFAGSGTVTNQIILGVPAQVGILSTELDAQRLVQQNVLPSATWKNLPHNGTLNLTPFVILTRKNNPKNISDYADLGKNIGIVHADPRTSGGAMWGILAEYGSAKQLGASDAEAEQQLAAIWKNVVAQASSARGARTQFENGFGDVLITYEQEALFDLARGKFGGEIVYPRSTILSEHTVVVIEHNIAAQDRELIDAFVEFLWSDTAQRIFTEHGFRSVDDAINQEKSFARIEKPFRVSDLGGWDVAKRDVIDAVWADKIISANPQ